MYYTSRGRQHATQAPSAATRPLVEEERLHAIPHVTHACTHTGALTDNNMMYGCCQLLRTGHTGTSAVPQRGHAHIHISITSTHRHRYANRSPLSRHQQTHNCDATETIPVAFLPCSCCCAMNYIVSPSVITQLGYVFMSMLLLYLPWDL